MILSVVERPRTSTPAAFHEKGCWKILWPRSPAKCPCRLAGQAIEICAAPHGSCARFASRHVEKGWRLARMITETTKAYPNEGGLCEGSVRKVSANSNRSPFSSRQRGEETFSRPILRRCSCLCICRCLSISAKPQHRQVSAMIDRSKFARRSQPGSAELGI